MIYDPLVFQQGPLQKPQAHQYDTVDLADGEGPLHAVEKVKELVGQRRGHLLGRNALVDNRDHDSGGHEAADGVEGGHRRLAPLGRELRAHGLRHGNLDKVLVEAVDHPVAFPRHASGSVPVPRSQGKLVRDPDGVPVGMAILVRLDVVLDPERLHTLQKLLPAVRAHQRQRRPLEVCLGELQQGMAVNVLEGLRILLHALFR